LYDITITYNPGDVLKVKVWDSKARIHDFIFKIPPLSYVKKEEKNIFVNLISDQPFNRGRILDIGCGTGEFTQFFKGNNCIFGADVSSEMIVKARRKMPNVNFIRADVCHLPFKDSVMDFVSIVGLLEYFKEQRKPLFEASRALRDNCSIVISFSKESIFNLPRKIWGIDYYAKNENEMKELLAISDLKIIKKVEGRIQTQFLCTKK
jgi:ubiquinone/menaquinone biosynthesis C-methylase UbiE